MSHPLHLGRIEHTDSAWHDQVIGRTGIVYENQLKRGNDRRKRTVRTNCDSVPKNVRGVGRNYRRVSLNRCMSIEMGLLIHGKWQGGLTLPLPPPHMLSFSLTLVATKSVPSKPILTMLKRTPTDATSMVALASAANASFLSVQPIAGTAAPLLVFGPIRSSTSSYGCTVMRSSCPRTLSKWNEGAVRRWASAKKKAMLHLVSFTDIRLCKLL